MTALQNKVIWITGASSGIGLEMARQLDGNGNKLVLSARRRPVLEELKGNLKFPGDVLILPLDLEQQDGYSAAVEQVRAAFGRIDLVIHNGGISQRSTVAETNISVDRRLMEVNFFGTVALTKAVLPVMLAQGGGQFAVVSSLTGKFGFGLRSAYAASKHALHGFFESLSIELGGNGIAVTMLCPGPVQTNISVNALNGSGAATLKMDEMQQQGMPVEKAVALMLKAIALKKPEIVIGNFREQLAVKLKRFLPSLFVRMARRQNPVGAVK